MTSTTLAAAKVRSSPDESLIAALSEVAAEIQRQQTVDGVLEKAGRGALRLGIRFAAFQIVGDEVLLRHIATAAPRLRAIEEHIGRRLQGLRIPLSAWELRNVTSEGSARFLEDSDMLERFVKRATGYDPAPLDEAPETAGIPKGLLAPLRVREESWGLLVVASNAFTHRDAPALSLFATHVASALEGAEFIERLERTNRELATCYAELARAQQESMRRERLAAVGELAAVVAHEVRNPLGVLFNTIGTLRRVLSTEAPVQVARAHSSPPSSSAPPAGATQGARVDRDAEGRERVETLLAIAEEEADRLNRIVRDLLEFANPNEPYLVRASLPEVVMDAVAAASARDQVTVEIDPGLLDVEMDTHLARQAILNVLLNGLQAMAPTECSLRVRIRMALRNAKLFACVDVIDSGPGIPVAVRANIFEPFFTTKAAGTGLGLAIVKRTMESHRGEVTVETGPTGTTFTLWFAASATCDP